MSDDLKNKITGFLLKYDNVVGKDLANLIKEVREECYKDKSKVISQILPSDLLCTCGGAMQGELDFEKCINSTACPTGIFIRKIQKLKLK